MDKEQTTPETLHQAVSLDEAFIQIQAQPKRQYTQQKSGIAAFNERHQVSFLVYKKLTKPAITWH